MVIVTESSLDPSALYAKLQKEGAGSVIFHYAVVKSQSGEKQTSAYTLKKMETWKLNFHQLKMIL
jgi:molybdopterin synthase catalytic subunit